MFYSAFRNLVCKKKLSAGMRLNTMATTPYIQGHYKNRPFKW